VSSALSRDKSAADQLFLLFVQKIDSVSGKGEVGFFLIVERGRRNSVARDCKRGQREGLLVIQVPARDQLLQADFTFQIADGFRIG
jgi:hypothetical protein